MTSTTKFAKDIGTKIKFSDIWFSEKPIVIMLNETRNNGRIARLTFWDNNGIRTHGQGEFKTDSSGKAYLTKLSQKSIPHNEFRNYTSFYLVSRPNIHRLPEEWKTALYH